MAALNGVALTSEVALVAATPKTVIQLIAASNHRVRVLGWGVFFDGVSATAEPVQVRLLRQSTAGTMSALTPVEMHPADETMQTTASYGASAEPTAGDVLDCIECHPQGGYEKWFPPGYEVIVPGSGRLGLELTAPAGVNVRAKFFFEE